MNRLELRIPPLLFLSAIAALMYGAAQLAPGAEFSVPARRASAIGIAAIGLGIALAGVVSFRTARTTVNPLKPDAVSALVTSGIYQHTRNPMYLGMLMVLAGWGAFLGNALSLSLLPCFVLYMNRFQIAPEEKVLASLFASAFTDYRSNVRRWL